MTENERATAETVTLFIPANSSVGNTFSKDRTQSIYGNSQSITFTFQEFHHIRAYRVDQLFVPGSWYNITDLRFNWDGTDYGPFEGQYTGPELAAVLTVADLSTSYNTSSKTFAFRNTAGTDKQLTPGTENSATVLGLDYQAMTITAGSTQSGTYMARLNPHTYFYMECPQLKSTSHNVKTGHTNTICAIPAYVSAGMDLHWEAPQEESSFAILPSQQVVDDLDFRLVDINGKLIDLHGVPFHLTLTLDTRSAQSVHTSADYLIDPNQ